MPPVVDESKCSVCKICVDVCPGDILTVADGHIQVLYADECAHCGACYLDCPQGAISFYIPLTHMLTTKPHVFK